MNVTVLHDGANASQYRVAIARQGRDFTATGQQLMMPFAGSDFAIADLGLEFFHWPEQDLTKKEMKRSRSCKVLESKNFHPTPGGYSRVVSWIDNESDGIVMAQAYDLQGKLLKQFIPKKVEKVNGQWQLQEMEIDNAQTGSSTRVDFDLNKP
jgi:YD repeat-containing protein